METERIQNGQTIAAKDTAADTDQCQEQQTKEQLLSYIRSLRARMAGLERLESEHERVEQALIVAIQEWEATFNATRDPICWWTRTSE